jgi:hypothetical protein
MPFIKLEKPIEEINSPYEAYHSEEISIAGPDGLSFRMEIMCITSKEFKDNAKLIMEKTTQAINALLSKTGGVISH